MKDLKTKQPDTQLGNPEKKFPWEFMVLMISLSIGGFVMLLKMIGIF